MDNIVEPSMDYDFSKLYLGPPTTLAGGAYFTRIMYNNNKQLYIQTPKSLTKQGFVKSGKKIYADLMFDNNDTIFINWIENLESKCQELIYTKSDTWFENKLEKDDIETAFTSPFKIFKSGKYYLLRVNVKPNIKIYDENDQIASVDDISIDKTIISILEIQGIKFTSRNFQLEIELKQSMIVSPDPFLDECFIKKPLKKNTEKISSEIYDKENLDEIINKSANDLALKTFSESSEKKVDSIEKNVKDNKNEEESEPIDLEITNDELKNDIIKESNKIIEEANDDKNNKNNITLDIEEINPEPEEIKEDPNILKEVDLISTLDNSLETITLKKPNQVYYEIYQKAREKAKEAKKNAILAFLEMKNIKKTYMLDDIDASDSEFEEFESRESESNKDSDNESLEDSF
jgi:hypothetical protein